MSRRYNFFDDRLKIDVPDVFAQIKDEEIGKYYPGNRPQVAFASEDKRAVFSASVINIDIKEENIEKRIFEYAQMYQRACPNFDNYTFAKREINDGKQLALFYFTSTTLEKDLTTCVILASINGKEFTSEMHCDFNASFKYMPQFMRMIDSIRIRDDKKEADFFENEDDDE